MQTKVMAVNVSACMCVYFYAQFTVVNTFLNRESSESSTDEYPDSWSPPLGPISLESGSEVSVCRMCV